MAVVYKNAGLFTFAIFALRDSGVKPLGVNPFSVKYSRLCILFIYVVIVLIYTSFYYFISLLYLYTVILKYYIFLFYNTSKDYDKDYFSVYILCLYTLMSFDYYFNSGAKIYLKFINTYIDINIYYNIIYNISQI